MIKFTIILIAIYILLKGFITMYINGLSPIGKIRVGAKSYTTFETILFVIFGLLHIVTWICVVISGVSLVFRYL